MYLNRQLDPREKRRLKIHYMLPIDVVDPCCRTSELMHNNVKTLYYYGSGLDKMFLDLDNFKSKHKFISNIRGFCCPILCCFSSAFICFYFSYNFRTNKTIETRNVLIFIIKDKFHVFHI